MATTSGPIGIWCPACDRAQTPALLQRQLSGKSEGMLLKCPSGHTYSYDRLMQLHPRMVQPTLVERQPPNTVVHPVWIYPEVLAALQSKFPQNLATTLCSVMTSLADPDSVLIEGHFAREMSSLGIKRGREVLALAKEVIELRKKVEEQAQEKQIIQNLFRSLGLGAGLIPSPVTNPPVTDAIVAPPTDANGNPLSPPRAQFAAPLTENAEGLLVPADGSEQRAEFTMPQGAAPVASAVPGFVTRLGRG